MLIPNKDREARTALCFAVLSASARPSRFGARARRRRRLLVPAAAHPRAPTVLRTQIDQSLLQDSDLAGPFFFCCLLAFALTLVRVASPRVLLGQAPRWRRLTCSLSFCVSRT